MPSIEKHAPGSFCWMELGTTNQAAAKDFYGSLFGWESRDFPMGPGETYTIFQLQGRDSAAGYTICAEDRARGIPPHWMLYIETDDVDKSTAKVAGLGGTVHAGPFDVMDKGRMSVIQDPAGAIFALWQSKASTGVGIAGEDNSFCWADLNTPDREKVKAFYAGLFGWEFDLGKGKDPNGYWHIKNGEHMIGGVPPGGMQNPNAPPHWLLYFQVADCDAATDKAKSLGAMIVVPPMTIEGAGRFSLIADPQGAVFAAFTNTMG